VTEKEVRHRREALFLLRQLLQRCLIFDGLRTEQELPLNFFRVYQGALMDTIAVDWCKIFGSDGQGSHSKTLYPSRADQDLIRKQLKDALKASEWNGTFLQLWNEVKPFRDTASAHLDFDTQKRAQVNPTILPIRLTAEVLYGRLYSDLRKIGQTKGYPPLSDLTGTRREAEVANVRGQANAAREALKDFKNSPFLLSRSEFDRLNGGTSP
jgi:hypothetical protein